MEMVDKEQTEDSYNGHWVKYDSIEQVIEIANRGLAELLSKGMPSENGDIAPPQKPPTKMKLKSLQTDAKDLFLCKNGEILFRVDE